MTTESAAAASMPRPEFARLDETHSPTLQSWVMSANGHADFPIQNLPFVVFAAPGRPPNVGVAIGEEIFDLAGATAAGLLSGAAAVLGAAANASDMDAMMGLTAAARKELRAQLSELLSTRTPDRTRASARTLLHRRVACQLLMPSSVPNYTDFYAGIHHAQRVGELLRPDAPLLPNYTYIPIGYHGRASTVRASGTDFVRPRGQIRPDPKTSPVFEVCRRLDFELEMGVWAGKSASGGPVSIADAHESCWGFSLLNDWSARDIQTWEYQPLGPFLGKSFCTTVSPFVITPEALAPFRVAAFDREAGGYPKPLAYLNDPLDEKFGGIDISLSVHLLTHEARQLEKHPFPLSRSNTRHLFWTFAQMVAHHTSGGCELVPGDLLGSGTISGPTLAESGSLLELTAGGKNPIDLGEGVQRTFLLDGDEITLRGGCEREGFVSIGFGHCTGRVLAN